MVLSDYMKTLQGFLRDRKQQNMNPQDLVLYLNRSRREIALRTQSIRVLTPISGSILTIQVIAGGSGYTAPVVTIGTPDFPNGAKPFPAGRQAVATAQFIGGVISNVSIVDGGSGYFQPTAKITDPHGTGAVLVASVNPINVTAFQQEIYNFSDVPLQGFPGVDGIFAVKSVSMIYANYRYSLPCYDFSTYQAHIRQYPTQYSYIPTVFGQFGQGKNGSLYMYPIPSTTYQMEWDCFCSPADLTTDSDYEAIPQPWQDAVPYFAAHLSYLELQNFNAAKFYLDLYDNMVHRYSSYARPGRTINPYGRY